MNELISKIIEFRNNIQTNKFKNFKFKSQKSKQFTSKKSQIQKNTNNFRNYLTNIVFIYIRIRKKNVVKNNKSKLNFSIISCSNKINIEKLI